MTINTSAKRWHFKLGTAGFQVTRFPSAESFLESSGLES
jgi:hypothetical protein